MGQYFYHQAGKNLFFRMQGKMKYTSSVGFDRIISEKLGEDTDTVLVDLQDVEYIDSTNLGLIARMAEFMIEHKKNRLLLLSTRDDINELLGSLGFDQVCTIIRTAPEDTEFREVPVKTGNEKEIMKLMIDAHKKLIALHKENRDTFQEVVDLLEKESGA